MSLLIRREGEQGDKPEKKKILPDPSAELVVLLSGSKSEGYRILSVIRILGFRQNSINILTDRDLREKIASLIREEMERVKATARGFINKDEFERILAGTSSSSSELGDVLRQNRFSDNLSIMDIEI